MTTQKVKNLIFALSFCTFTFYVLKGFVQSNYWNND
jgi:hypothetical protein